MKKLRKISRKYYLRQIVICWMIYSLLFFIPVRIASAAPNGGNFQKGTGAINDNVQHSTVQVNQMESVIHWGSLDTSSSESLSFSQAEGLNNAAVLNRVVGIEGPPSMTQFDGALNGPNMRIFMVNPAGIVFGSTATVSVSQLVASSLNLTNDAFTNGLATGSFQFTGGGLEGTGNVINEGSITAERIALIAKNVINRGDLVASKYAVMAAGDTVVLTDGSPVTVAVTMPDGWVSGSGNYEVRNEDGDGIDVKGETAQVVLAAGDVWSAALVKAYSGGGSDAVATVDITAAGDVTITDDVVAEAVSNGVDNAIANVTITAGGYVEATGTVFDDTEIRATASDGLNNTAKVDISAQGDVTQNDAVIIKAEACSEVNPELGPSNMNRADVLITGRNVTIETLSEGWIDAWFSANALIGAYAQNANVNMAKVNITATGGEVVVEDVSQFVAGNVLLQAGGLKDCAIVEAVAKGGSRNYADVAIDATGDVSVIANSANSKIIAEASNKLDEGDLVDGTIAGLTNIATVNITAGGGVEIKGEGRNGAVVEAVAKNVIDLTPEIPAPEVVIEIIDNQEVEVEQEVVVGLAVEGLTNTANVNITAGNVDVEAACESSGAEAIVKATAENEMKVNIVNLVKDEAPAVTVNLDVADLENSAGVTITANGEECGDIVVGGDHGYGLVRAEAYNTLEVEHKGSWCWWSYYPVADATVNLTVDGLQNTATVDITATNGSVEVMANGGYYGWGWKWNPYTAGVEAEAYNSMGMDFDSTTTGNLTLNDLVNNANITITANAYPIMEGDEVIEMCGGNVEVLAYNGGYAGIKAQAWNEFEPSEEASGPIIQDNMINDAGVTIDAGGSVKVKAECQGDCSEAEIAAEAYNDTPKPENEPQNIANTANVDITAGDEVKVIGKDCGDAYILAETRFGTDNTSGVTINTSDGDVLVLGVNGDASIEAIAEEGGDNTATILINAVGGDVKVIDIGEGGDNTAKIEARAEEADNSNTADVTINATAKQVTESVEVYPDVFGEITEVYGGDVKVIAKEGGKAAITALAKDAASEKTNTANVTINATGAEATELVPVEPILKLAAESVEPIVPEFKEVTQMEGGDVKVIAECGGEAEIEALAIDGVTNVADVLICIEGGVKVKGDKGGKAEIEALAKGNYATTNNTATVGIGAKGEEGVQVIADRGGEAGISSKAKDGENNNANTASTIVCTGGGVDVKATHGGDAEILAQAETAITNNAYVGIGAMGDVVVQTGEMPDGEGCDAVIRAEADTGDLKIQQLPDEEPIVTTTDAEVVVFSHEGSVEVLAYNHGHSGIEAEAQGAHLNTAKVGVAAGADLSPSDVILPEQPIVGVELALVSDGFDPLPLSGNVLVEAFGDSEAQILAWAHDATSIFEYPEVSGDTQEVTTQEPTIIPGENTAKTVICAPGEVRVTADEGSDAKIKSWAGGWGEEDSINTATTQVYASEVKVDVPDRRGNGISAWAVGSELINVPDNYPIIVPEFTEVPDDGRLTYCLGDDGTVAITDGTSTLIVDTYSNRKDCPTCPPCPCEKPVPPEKVVVVPPPPAEEIKEEVFAPVAPLPQVSIPRIEGCPGLMLATASELGIAGETFQVAMGNSLALNPSLQPCGACATLLNAARILRDEDGSRMAAINQVFNSLAPANAPMTPEMEATIAMAFAENAAEGSQYALAKEYIDAFVQYAAVLDVQLGSPVGDSIAFVMAKYGAGITESSNRNMAAFVMSRMESAGTLSK